MPNSIALINQLAPLGTAPALYVKKREADILLLTGQAVWALDGRVLRKTHKYRRLVSDALIQKQSKSGCEWRPKQSGYAGPTVMQMENAQGFR